MPWNPRIRTITTILVSCLALDQLTKVIAARYLGGADPIVMLGGFLRFEYTENRGAFLSLGASMEPWLRTLLFVGGVGLVLVVMLVMLVRDQTMDRPTMLALTLVVSGGIGNLIDRITLGVVRDFANVGIGSLRTGIFNVADLALTTGAILFLLGPWIVRRRKPKEAA